MGEIFSDIEVQRALDLVYELTGVRMSASKSTLLQGRLRARIAENKLSSLGGYLDLLERDKGELARFIDVVTTHETYFCRTSRVWEYFSQEFLPALKRETLDEPLHIWSAAASTGEEAYTIAMHCEDFAKAHSGFRYSIFASDISTEVLRVAQKGVYSGRSLDMLKKASPHFVEKYMIAKNAEEMEVRNELRAKVKFNQQNLFNLRDVKTKFDIIFLRNVLIYFDRPDQEKVIATLAEHLAPEGVIVIGESESLNSIDTTLEYLQPLVYGRKKVS